MWPYNSEIIFYILMVFFLALIALKIKAVDLRGAFACLMIGYLILFVGGVEWFIIILLFFILSTYFTKFRYNYKKEQSLAQEKGGTRSWPNAVANGSVATTFAFMEFFFGGSVYALAFLGAMATATADTLATEIGLLSKKEPRLITNLHKRVAPGTSGGVTYIGTITAVLASFIIAIIAVFLNIVEIFFIETLIIVTISGTIGCVFDSIFGAKIQRVGTCSICGITTENLSHCGKTTKRKRGLNFLDNNGVNFLSTICGAFSSIILFTIIR